VDDEDIGALRLRGGGGEGADPISRNAAIATDKIPHGRLNLLETAHR